MTRTKLIGLDVMLDKGTRYYTTIYYRAPLHKDAKTGMWTADYDAYTLKEYAKSKLPSLQEKPFTLAINK